MRYNLSTTRGGLLDFPESTQVTPQTSARGIKTPNQHLKRKSARARKSRITLSTSPIATETDDFKGLTFDKTIDQSKA